MSFPKTKVKNMNDLTLCWEDVYPPNKGSYNFRLQICDDLKEWKTIYCGPNTEFKVHNLAPCTCYSLRVKPDDHENWLHFKAATEDAGPYTSVIHMSRAVRLGKTSVIRKIANVKPVLLNTENKERKTPLFQAIEAKDLQVLHLLITLGSNVNKPLLHTRKTALMFAIYKGAASLLIDKGAHVFCKDINGLTILHYAVDSNELSNVIFAVETQLDINVQDSNGWTPLIRSGILQCKLEIMEYLITKGADKLIKDKNDFNYEKHLKLIRQF